jgi:hypothetical protein
MWNPFEHDREGRRIIVPAGHEEWRDALAAAVAGRAEPLRAFLRMCAADQARRSTWRDGMTLEQVAHQAGRLAAYEQLLRDIDTLGEK